MVSFFFRLRPFGLLSSVENGSKKKFINHFACLFALIDISIQFVYTFHCSSSSCVWEHARRALFSPSTSIFLLLVNVVLFFCSSCINILHCLSDLFIPTVIIVVLPFFSEWQIIMTNTTLLTSIEPISPYTETFGSLLFFTIVYIIVLISGLVGNFIVIFVILKNKDLKHFTNYFFANLSAADVFVLIFCIPTAIHDIWAQDQWYLGKFFCKFFFLNISLRWQSFDSLFRS